jgi:6,7-dimethyl-8-ribityllumazine synthase
MVAGYTAVLAAFIAVAVGVIGGATGYGAVSAFLLQVLLSVVALYPLPLIFGILALRDIRRNPQKRGVVRAWFGISIAAIIFFIQLVFFVCNR